MKKWVILGLIAGLFLSHPTQGFAGDYTDNFARNVVRGVKNITTGWFEIPREIYLHNQAEKTPVIRELRGLVVGAVSAVARTSSGLWDLGTSFLPGDQEGEPVEPETLL